MELLKDYGHGFKIERDGFGVMYVKGVPALEYIESLDLPDVLEKAKQGKIKVPNISKADLEDVYAQLEMPEHLIEIFEAIFAYKQEI